MKPSRHGICASRTSASDHLPLRRRDFELQNAFVRHDQPSFSDSFSLLGLLDHILDGALQVERLLRKIVVLAFGDFLEAADGVGELDVLALEAGELLGHVERLREELLDLAGARDGQLVFVGKLVDTENRDDVLQILVALQNPLHLLGAVVVLLADDARIENARGGRQRIDGRVDAEFGDGARKVGGGVEVREGGGRRGIGVVVGGHVDGLHRGDGARSWSR